jgi:hypothetical protein
MRISAESFRESLMCGISINSNAASCIPAFQQEPLEDGTNVELIVLGIAHAEGDILKVAEQSQISVIIHD